VAPELRRKAPAYFHAWREVRLKRRNRKTNESDKRILLTHLYGPQSEPITIKMVRDALNHRIALRSRQGARKVFHDAGIGVERRKRITVGRPPSPQQETFSVDLGR
jgi:hypothetical protein